MACSQSLCPSGVLVLPLSHSHSQTHTDVSHQQCIIFSLQSICLNSLSPCGTSASGDFISLYSYEHNMTASTSLTLPSMLLLKRLIFPLHFQAYYCPHHMSPAASGILPALLSQMPSALFHAFNPAWSHAQRSPFQHFLPPSEPTNKILNETTEKYLCYMMRLMPWVQVLWMDRYLSAFPGNCSSSECYFCLRWAPLDLTFAQPPHTILSPW